ncbi:MAG: ABC transporter permease [Atribacterota bacterium]|nr:ABC transporter permease [Candidatus Atribacteria bacterium]
MITNHSSFLSRLFHPERHSSSLIWLVLAALVIIVVTIVPEFVTPSNLSNVFVQMVPLGLVSVGQTFVILAGGIDLSVGSQISLVTLIAANIMGDSVLSILFSIFLCLLAGLAFGFLNGVLVHKVQIPPLIVTLCTGFIFQGIAYALHKTTGGYISANFQKVITASWGVLSMPFFLFIFFLLIGFYLLNRTRFGRYIYALGGNEEVLANTGVNTGRIKVASYVIAGVMAAITGLYLAARVKSGGALYGVPFTLNSVTAVVVGGSPLSGGEGGLAGTTAGVVIVSMLNNVLNLISFRFNLQSTFYKEILTGVILVIAMLFYRKRS